jgi:hypothetical protein
MKKVMFSVVYVLSLSLAIYSCKKINGTETKTVLENVNSNDSEKITLAEFKSSVNSLNEKYFFENEEIIDNSEYSNYYLNNIHEMKANNNVNAGVKWRWGGENCSRPLGVCLIFPGPSPKPKPTPPFYSDLTAATYIIDNKKMTIFPSSSVNGFTKDGYLPVYSDITVDKNTVVKTGIYKASFDTKLKRYTAVTVNLK